MRGVDIQGSRIKSLRSSRGMTQIDLANVSKLDVKTIRKAEQGKRLDLRTISQIADALQTIPASLLAMADIGTTMQKQWRDSVIQWLFWFDDEDVDKILTLYHEDAVLQLPGGGGLPFGGECRGKEAIRAANLAAWSATQHEPMSLDEISFFLNHTGVVIDGARRVTVPSGDLVSIPCVQVFKFRGKLISEHHVSFDTLDFARKLEQK